MKQIIKAATRVISSLIKILLILGLLSVWWIISHPSMFMR